MKAFYVFAVVVLAAVAAEAKSFSTLEKHPIDWYDCTGQADGNYEHPSDCTRFISCSGNIASERDCANCNVDAVRCPEGRLVYNSTVDECLWADQTSCGGGGGGPGTGTPQPEESTTNGDIITGEPGNPNPTTARPPGPGDDCDPDLCKNEGYCQNYLRCDKNTSKLVREECGENLVWNPLNPNGTEQVHGGNCDIWDNLSPELVLQYRRDPKCLGCFWEAIGECNANYNYQPPDGTHRNVLRLTCADGLVFSPAKETCQRCQDVNRKAGGTCC